MKLPEETISKIRELYPTMTHREIARALGISKASVDKYAKKMGLDHTSLSRSRIAESARRKRTDAERRLLSERRKAIYKSERRKKVLGIPQKTRYYVSLLPSHAQRVRNHLCNKRGYFFCADDDWTLYFDEETRRSPNETYFQERYRFRFVDAT